MLLANWQNSGLSRYAGFIPLFVEIVHIPWSLHGIWSLNKIVHIVPSTPWELHYASLFCSFHQRFFDIQERNFDIHVKFSIWMNTKRKYANRTLVGDKDVLRNVSLRSKSLRKLISCKIRLCYERYDVKKNMRTESLYFLIQIRFHKILLNSHYF